MATVPVILRVETAQELEDALNAALLPLTSDLIQGMQVDQTKPGPYNQRNLYAAFTYDTVGATPLVAPIQAKALFAQDEFVLTAYINTFIAANVGYFFSEIHVTYRQENPDARQGVIGVIFYCSDPNAASNWSASSGGAMGAVGGDLSGFLPNPTVVGLRGRPISAAAPSGGQTLVYDAVANQWKPTTNPSYYVSGAAAQAAAPHINGSFVIISPGSPTSQAGTWQVTANQGAAFPADYTKVSDLTDTASEVGIVDAGNFFSGTNVEDALQEVGAGTILPQTGALPIGTTVMASLAAANYGTGEWALELVNGNLRYRTTLAAVHDGATAALEEFGAAVGPGIGVLPVSFDADINGGNLRLLATATVGGWSYKVRCLAALPT